MAYEAEILTFVLDDSKIVLDNIEEALTEIKVKHRSFLIAEDFFSAFNEYVQICIIDFHLKGNINGINVAVKAFDLNPDCKMIIISAEPSIDIAVANFLNENKGRMNSVRYLYKLSDTFIEDLQEYVKIDLETRRRDIKLYNSLISKLKKYEAGGTNRNN